MDTEICFSSAWADVEFDVEFSHSCALEILPEVFASTKVWKRSIGADPD